MTRRVIVLVCALLAAAAGNARASEPSGESSAASPTIESKLDSALQSRIQSPGRGIALARHRPNGRRTARLSADSSRQRRSRTLLPLARGPGRDRARRVARAPRTPSGSCRHQPRPRRARHHGLHDDDNRFEVGRRASRRPPARESAWRPLIPASTRGTRISEGRVVHFADFVNRAVAAVRRLRPRHARRRHHRGQRPDSNGVRRGVHRARTSSCSRRSTSTGNGFIEQRHRRY